MIRNPLLALVLLCATVTACGDDLHPPAPDAAVDAAPKGIVVTYNDAWQGWARGYCAYAQRCFPLWVFEYHHDEEGCVGDIQVANCGEDWAKCASVYAPVVPEIFPGQPNATLDTIFRCTADFAVISCDAHFAPASCALLR